MSGLIFASWIPCDWSLTVSWSGHLVAAMRRRRSRSCSSGMLTRKERIVLSSFGWALATADTGASVCALPGPGVSARAAPAIADSESNTERTYLLITAVLLQAANAWKCAERASKVSAQRLERGPELLDEGLRL